MTVISNQRVFKRFHIYIVAEFTSVSRPAESFLGITRDCSVGGFSFESHAFDLEPGDVLEFRLKHPDVNLAVSSLGEIVWKSSADKFSCTVGIKFREIADSDESLMLKLMSAAGNVPAPAFLSSMDSDGVNNGNTPAPDDAAIHEETLDIADNNVLSDSADKETETEGGLHYCGQLTFGEAAQVRQKSIVPYMAIILSVTVVLLFTLVVPLEDNMTGSHKSENYFMKNPPREDMYGTHSSSAASSAREGNGTMLKSTVSGQLRALPEEISSISETDAAAGSEQSVSGINGFGNREYFIQVGSWKNPVYAEEARGKIVKYYPDAYMLMRNNFHVLRIPGVMTKSEGNAIAEDIQAKFKFSPLVVLKSE